MVKFYVKSGTFYAETHDAEDWQYTLASPERQWRSGYSARTLAYCWEATHDFPPEIAQIFASSGLPSFVGIHPLLGLVEHKVRMPGRGKPSQNDLFVFAEAQGRLISLMIEGKVSESLGGLLQDWDNGSANRQTRLNGIFALLGLSSPAPPTIRYQLLHRMASAVIEAQRFGASAAVMLIHTFSPIDKWFTDYQNFLALYGREGNVGELVYLRTVNDIHLFTGWVHGNEEFLTS